MAPGRAFRRGVMPRQNKKGGIPRAFRPDEQDRPEPVLFRGFPALSFYLSVAVRTICHLPQRQTAHPIRGPPSSHTTPRWAWARGSCIAATPAHIFSAIFSPPPPAASFLRLWPPASEGNTDRTKTKEKERTNENPNPNPAVPRGGSHAEGGTDYPTISWRRAKAPAAPSMRPGSCPTGGRSTFRVDRGRGPLRHRGEGGPVHHRSWDWRVAPPH